MKEHVVCSSLVLAMCGSGTLRKQQTPYCVMMVSLMKESGEASATASTRR